MSRTKRPKYVPKPFESRGLKYEDTTTGAIKPDTSANIYESMLVSNAFKDLSTRQKLLYMYVKAQYYGKRKPSKDNTETGLFQSDEYFYLNLDTVTRKYGLYTRNMRSEFYGDMKALIEHGFITKESQGGGNGKTKNIYRYSDKWQAWGTE